jgi:hypothetical protein
MESGVTLPDSVTLCSARHRLGIRAGHSGSAAVSGRDVSNWWVLEAGWCQVPKTLKTCVYTFTCIHRNQHTAPAVSGPYPPSSGSSPSLPASVVIPRLIQWPFGIGGPAMVMLREWQRSQFGTLAQLRLHAKQQKHACGCS